MPATTCTITAGISGTIHLPSSSTAASITSRYDLTYTAHWVDETTGDLEISTVTATSQLFPVLGGAIGLAFPNAVAARLDVPELMG